MAIDCKLRGWKKLYVRNFSIIIRGLFDIAQRNLILPNVALLTLLVDTAAFNADLRIMNGPASVSR